MSAEPGKVFECRFQNKLQELELAREEAMRFLTASGLDSAPVQYRLSLAIEELATNILKYSYSDNARHEVLLRLEVQPKSVELTLEDDGRPFNPLEAPTPDIAAPVEERAVGGLGIHLVRQLVDQMTYERCGERNRLTVRIRS